MSGHVSFLLALYASLLAVPVAALVAAVALALVRLREVPVSRTLAGAAALAALVALAGAGWAGVIAGSAANSLVAGAESALVVLVAMLLGALVFAALPLTVGRWLVAGLSGATPESSLRYAVAGWPVGLAASLAVFVAPGGAARYNLTFLDGPAAVVGWTAWAASLLFGPGLAGALVARLRASRPTRPAR